MSTPTVSDTQTTQYRINGLDCPDCAAKVEKVAGKVSGISGVRVEFTMRTLSAQVESPEALKRLPQHLSVVIHHLGRIGPAVGIDPHQ